MANDQAWGFAQAETDDEKKAREMFDLLWAERTSAEHDEITALRAKVAELHDENARLCSNADDRRHKRTAEERLAIMEQVAPWLASVTPGHGAERHAILHLLAHVAEHGKVPSGLEEMRAAHAEWEGRRGV